MSFLPDSLLKNIDFEKMDIKTFLAYLAKARYLEEVRQMIYTNGIIAAFSEE